MPLQPGPVARDPLGGGAQPRQPRDQSDAGVAEAGEVLDQLFDGAGVLGAHLIMGVAHQPVEEDGGDLAAGQIFQQPGRLGRRGDDHAVHPPFVEQPDDLALMLGIVMRIGDQQPVPLLQGAGLDALEDLGEVRIADRRDGEPDRAGARGHQGARQRIGDVLEVVDGVQHGLTGVRTDRPGLVEHMRDGGHGHPGTPGDVDHGCHPLRSSASRVVGPAGHRIPGATGFMGATGPWGHVTYRIHGPA
ncbi:hypothetical protein SANTM175S_09621 [Streptomyces antimycoticus]